MLELHGKSGRSAGEGSTTPNQGGDTKSSGDSKGEFLARLATKAASGSPGKSLQETSQAPGSESRDLELDGWESSSSATIREESQTTVRFASADSARATSKQAEKKVRVSHAIAAMLVAVVAAVFVSAVATWNLGVQAGERRLLDEQTKAGVSVSEEYLARLNRAFEDLRSGRPRDALKTFQELEAGNPGVSSMAYLIALTAMRSKNFALAEEQATRSIRKQERISDSLAIQALIEIQKSEDPDKKKLGDPVLRSELLLRRAMLADPANPVPMIELSGLLRRQKKNTEAIQLLQAARTRVQPFDLPLFLEATIILTTLQGTPDSELPDAGDPGKDLPTAISAAYLSMRKGQYPAAATILKGIRSQTAPSYFHYLMSDPAMRPYSRVRELQEFFF